MLGPLLFLVFIADFGRGLNPDVGQIFKYVDDSKIIGFVKLLMFSLCKILTTYLIKSNVIIFSI